MLFVVLPGLWQRSSPAPGCVVPLPALGVPSAGQGRAFRLGEGQNKGTGKERPSTKIYFGESLNVVTRLGTHFDELTAGRHECKEMQEDWNKYGSSSFAFVSLSVGEQWSDPAVRRKSEQELVTLNQGLVYNQKIGGSTKKKEADSYNCKL